MQVKSFTYTKATDTISDRTVLVISEPSTLLKALDISELDDETQAVAAVEFGRLHDEYLQKLEVFKKEFDLTKSFRSFDSTKMSNITVDHV